MAQVDNTEIPLIYTLESRGGIDAPLFLLVHGRANRLGVMSIFKRYLPEGSNVLSVEAPWVDPDGGFSWWDIKALDERHRLKIPSADAIYQTFEEVLQKNGLKPSAKIAIGFSQGGGILSIVMQRYPDAFLGIGILSGFFLPLESFEAKADSFPLKRSAVFICHGRTDQIVPFANAERGRDALLALGHEVTFVAEEGGHKVGIEAGRALKSWVEQLLA